jgi:hypothetical protein
MSYLGNQPNSVAFLTDQFSGNGSTVVFTMSVAPAATSSILVNISGITQDPTTYAISGTTLTFSAAPPLGVGNISVRYLGIPASAVATTAYRTVTEFTATANQVTFNVPSYTIGYIDVYRNGVRLGAADFTASNGTTVVLAAGALLGDLIVTESFYVSSVLNAIPAVAGAVNSTYITDQAITQQKLAPNVAGNGPAFSAYRATSQTITTGTYTKVSCDTEEFDTNSNYDKDTNYRFTPTVAGYYQVDGQINIYAASGMTRAFVGVYKNGAIAKWGMDITLPSSISGARLPVSSLIYCNGTTDYLELYCYLVGSGTLILSAGTSDNYFQASLVRAA